MILPDQTGLNPTQPDLPWLVSIHHYSVLNLTQTNLNQLKSNQLKNEFYFISAGCPLPPYQGDGFCDDENNVPECSYDGGDCCGPLVQTQYCSFCICYEN